MKKIILLLIIFTFAFSVEKWEYLIGEFNSKNGFMTMGLTYEEDESFSKYTTLIEQGDKDASYYAHVALKTALNKMGADGWELINIVATQINPAKTQREIKKPRLENVFYFKRMATNKP